MCVLYHVMENFLGNNKNITSLAGHKVSDVILQSSRGQTQPIYSPSVPKSVNSRCSDMFIFHLITYKDM